MARKRTRAAEPLPTIWRVPDELWARITPVLLKHDPPAKTGLSASRIPLPCRDQSPFCLEDALRGSALETLFDLAKLGAARLVGLSSPETSGLLNELPGFAGGFIHV